jgi:tRNA-binding protein
VHVVFDPAAPRAPEISFDEFLAVDIRIGTVTSAEVFPEARNPSYKLRIDFGPGVGELKSAAQITDFYDPADLVGQQVLAVVNFPPRQIGPSVSEVLVLGLAAEGGAIALVSPDRAIPNGTRLA